ncbi:hypothetical protein HER12_000412 [Spiroplasma platyhelix PALS-1]|nr:hypothetical protein [Spiroplasma platyhelix PALS-1]UJB29424.1 hypothetical protein SPLAT_v1c06600 [Spiroplasma platyhelix PALS-1]
MFHALLTNLIANIPFLILFAETELVISVNVITWVFSLTQVIAWLLMILFIYFEFK